MKTISIALLAVFLSFMFVGCSSTRSKVDWNARVGSFTFDQAVTELGPPDKTARLSDGRSVSSWIMGHTGGGSGLTVGTGFYGAGGGIGVSQRIGSNSGYDRVLTLTFDTDGKLESFKKNY